MFTQKKLAEDACFRVSLRNVAGTDSLSIPHFEYDFSIFELRLIQRDLIERELLVPGDSVHALLSCSDL